MEKRETCIDVEQINELHLCSLAKGPRERRQDLLRRFSSTSLREDIQLMGRTVRVESNNPGVLDMALQFFLSHQHRLPSEPEFVWRLIIESDETANSAAVPLTAFSDIDLRLLNIGQRSFVAVDLAKREAVGFLCEEFLGARARFQHRPPLDILFCMTASSLGLVSLSGGCVGENGRGVMVFGAPNSGKTTSCYLAARSGLEFHADQVLFADARRACVWGDPFPAVFRIESLQFLPELREQVHHSSYGDSDFCYFDKSSSQPREALPIIPVCSLFLNRQQGAQTALRQISRDEAMLRLRESVLFEEDQRFEEQVSSVLQYLTEKPVYELCYDCNPAIAADYIRTFLQ